MQLRKHKIRFSAIDNIFISHLHGDHCFGLIGLVSTFGLLGRVKDLNIFAHPDLENILQPQIKYFCDALPYKVNFVHIDPRSRKIIYKDSKVMVETLPLKHRVPTCGFLFRELQRDRHVNHESCDFYKVPLQAIPFIKKGENYVTPDGTEIDNTLLTRTPPPARSYAFCSDTAFDNRLFEIVEGVDLLYHEATFLEQHEKLAGLTYHSTAKQAATIAASANVKKLIIGHFSARYHDLSAFEKEARAVFPNTDLARDGDIFHVPFVKRE